MTETIEQLEAWLLDLQVEQDTVGNACLVVAEALNNVVEHAYKFAPRGKIKTHFEWTGSCLTVDVLDWGVPFDGPPPVLPNNSPENDFDNLPEGGFGWFLIHSIAKSVCFSNTNGCNHLKIEISSE